MSNILLDVLDKELDRRNLNYVRYADDFSIYTKSKKEARKVGNEIYLFLRDKLRLPINRETPEHGSAKGAHAVLASEDLLTSNCWDMHLSRHIRRGPKED
ncbi:reverse transcriptase domain-containing protein [Cyclobacterium roseum]|uniref:reverse transcriptase domain-containing protein n=1 Tax=Cyclobacterium roseum TaxID=2666137 RepID=UPI001EFF1C87|nr:reverse transcriptase domain-containing protein [Cyclobacterium roseum]